MFFRNLSLFRFSEAMAASLAELETHLEQKRLRPCGPLEQSTRGFVSPHGRNAELLAHRAGNFVLVALGGEDKLLPGSVVNEELSARLQKITEEQGRRVGAKERKRMKDEILTDFLPRAFVKPFRMLAYADLKNGWLVVDTSSRKSAEEMLSELREAVGLRFEHDLPFAEIGRRLGRSEEAARQLCERALTRLRGTVPDHAN